jgi:hypothetical protein
MWHIQLKNGLAISQSQISNWNAIPPETQIEKAALIRERPDGTCYITSSPSTGAIALPAIRIAISDLALGTSRRSS